MDPPNEKLKISWEGPALKDDTCSVNNECTPSESKESERLPINQEINQHLGTYIQENSNLLEWTSVPSSNGSIRRTRMQDMWGWWTRERNVVDCVRVTFTLSIVLTRYWWVKLHNVRRQWNRHWRPIIPSIQMEKLSKTH